MLSHVPDNVYCTLAVFYSSFMAALCNTAVHIYFHPVVCYGHCSLTTLYTMSSRQSSSERQLNFVALNRGRHLCSAGRPSCWALAHILVLYRLSSLTFICCDIVYNMTSNCAKRRSLFGIDNLAYGTLHYCDDNQPISRLADRCN